MMVWPMFTDEAPCKTDWYDSSADDCKHCCAVVFPCITAWGHLWQKHCAFYSRFDTQSDIKTALCKYELKSTLSCDLCRLHMRR